MAQGKINSKGTKNKHKERNNTRLEYKEHKLIVITNN
jgi:hypothetical protein